MFDKSVSYTTEPSAIPAIGSRPSMQEKSFGTQSERSENASRCNESDASISNADANTATSQDAVRDSPGYHTLSGAHDYVKADSEVSGSSEDVGSDCFEGEKSQEPREVESEIDATSDKDDESVGSSSDSEQSDASSSDDDDDESVESLSSDDESDYEDDEDGDDDDDDDEDGEMSDDDEAFYSDDEDLDDGYDDDGGYEDYYEY